MDSGDIDTFYRNYYRQKYLEHGDTPKGVDWKDLEAQHTSFRFILDTISNHYPNLDSYSILELGCGYGAFFEFLKATGKQKNIDYFGIDLVDEMITQARLSFPEIGDHFYTGDFKKHTFGRSFDIVISSGVFNIKGDTSDTDYAAYIFKTIESMFSHSVRGIVFNLMTPAPDYKDPKLFYPSLDEFFGFIYKNLSRQVTMVSTFPLWKITIGIFK